MLNVVVLKGRLTKNVELRKSNGGNSIANFDLAIDNPRKEADGTRGSSFFPVKVFGSSAENLAKFVQKGSAVAVTGSIQQRTFLRADGTKGSVYEIYADSVEFLDAKPVEAPSLEDVNFDDVDEQVQVAEAVNQNPEPKPKFDAFTGKPLNTSAKK